MEAIEREEKVVQRAPLPIEYWPRHSVQWQGGQERRVVSECNTAFWSYVAVVTRMLRGRDVARVSLCTHLYLELVPAVVSFAAA